MSERGRAATATWDAMEAATLALCTHEAPAKGRGYPRARRAEGVYATRLSPCPQAERIEQRLSGRAVRRRQIPIGPPQHQAGQRLADR